MLFFLLGFQNTSMDFKMKGGNAGSRRGSCSFLCTVQEVAIPLPVLLKLSELTSSWSSSGKQICKPTAEVTKGAPNSPRLQPRDRWQLLLLPVWAAPLVSFAPLIQPWLTPTSGKRNSNYLHFLPT